MKTKTMLQQDSYCILCIDGKSVKSNLVYCTGTDEIVGIENFEENKKNTSICKNALVIIARGLFYPWKQPLAFFFVESTLKAKELRTILEKYVMKLTEIGLNVVAISSDMGSNFI